MSKFLSKLEILKFAYDITQLRSTHDRPFDVYEDAFKRLSTDYDQTAIKKIFLEGSNKFSNDYLLLDDLYEYFMITVLNGYLIDGFTTIECEETFDYTGTNMCVIDYNDCRYRITCYYTSYKGFDFDSLEIEIVDPIAEIIEQYDIVQNKSQLTKSEFIEVLAALERDLYIKNGVRVESTIDALDFESLCRQIHNHIMYDTHVTTNSITLVDVIYNGDTVDVVFKINNQHYKYTYEVSSMSINIFTYSYIKKVEPKPVTIMIYE